MISITKTKLSPGLKLVCFREYGPFNLCNAWSTEREIFVFLFPSFLRQRATETLWKLWFTPKLLGSRHYLSYCASDQFCNSLRESTQTIRIILGESTFIAPANWNKFDLCVNWRDCYWFDFNSFVSFNRCLMTKKLHKSIIFKARYYIFYISLFLTTILIYGGFSSSNIC